MAATQSVFLAGAGYIGQHILDQLLAAGYSVTVLIRRPEQASVFENAGAKTVVGTLTDLELLTAQTAGHEITINTTSSDDLPSVEAMLSGIRQRVHAGQPSIFIHTSGTGALEDGAFGTAKNDKIFRDDAPGDVEGIAPSMMHRHVDIPVAQAAREFGDKAKVAIILPPFVYGYNSAHKRHSFALAAMVRFALKHGSAGYVGEGRNVWSVVHVEDLGRAYIQLLAYIEQSASKSLVENPYFFAENGSEVPMGEVAEHIGQTMYELGKIPSPKARPFTESDYKDVMGPFTGRGLGCNSRSRAVRLMEFGWKPQEKDVWTSWKEDDIPALVAAVESAS